MTEQPVDGTPIGVNRVALVAMYHLWMALPADEKRELFEEVCEGDVDETLALVVAIVESVGFQVQAPPAVNPVFAARPEGARSMDAGYL